MLAEKGSYLEALGKNRFHAYSGRWRMSHGKPRQPGDSPGAACLPPRAASVAPPAKAGGVSLLLGI